METALGVMAALVCSLYSAYFWALIRSRPEVFERLLLVGLAEWMLTSPRAAPGRLRAMLALTGAAEAAYFALALAVIANPVFRALTALFILFEGVHLLRVGQSLARFFAGRISLGALFDWRLERAAAWLFFTHSLLVLVQLWWHS
ncbi:MAG: hypothetical protein QHH05_02760 [Syntrophomonadaceae bacterium]|jgi:hypothetical protein|nr:hypothetical protein [Syntrophomonadaceae bacterium]MDH7497353.1 hypothetical protein [Syntrophomonadaceae bacterium]